MPPAGARPAAAPPTRLGVRSVLGYGLLRAPLAWLELPLFVLLPAYYAQTHQVALGALGLTLLIARLIDACADPWIGATLDRPGAPTRWRRAIVITLPALALGYSALFWPPPGLPALPWLGLCAVLTYLAYSVVSIAYLAWGAQLGQTPAERVRVSATREALGLAGVVASAALLQPQWVPWLVAGFWVLAAVATWGLYQAPLPPAAMAAAPTAAEAVAEPGAVHSSGPGGGSGSSVPSISAAAAPARSDSIPPPRPEPAGTQADWRGLARHRPLRGVLGVFLCNGIANAIPATLVLFFVSDILRAPRQAPLFLLVYFLAAALGLPTWSALARRIGLQRAWALGMVVALAAFLWAWRLGAGDTGAFLLICLITGWALGADLALPTALLATLLAEPGAPRQREGTVLGVWNLITKLNLALAAGVALPALQWLGYQPNAATGTESALSMVYALLPSALKLLAAGLLLWLTLPAACSAPKQSS